jgi:hypothetical protein
MTTELTEKKSNKVRNWQFIVGGLVVLGVLTLYVFTALTLINVGLWAGVVWVWFGLFVARYLLKAGLRFAILALTGKNPSASTSSELNKAFVKAYKERNA